MERRSWQSCKQCQVHLALGVSALFRSSLDYLPLVLRIGSQFGSLRSDIAMALKGESEGGTGEAARLWD